MAESGGWGGWAFSVVSGLLGLLRRFWGHFCGPSGLGVAVYRLAWLVLGIGVGYAIAKRNRSEEFYCEGGPHNGVIPCPYCVPVARRTERFWSVTSFN